MNADRVALITGGTRGIGFGIAHRLALDGIHLVLNGRRPESEVATILHSLRDLGIRVEYCRADISLPDDRETLVKFVRNKFDALHILINNAGIAPKLRADILDATEQSFDDVVATNLRGPYFLTQLAARWMIDQRRQNAGFPGCIINITSISSEVASIYRGDYCISKAGMSMASKLWAVRLAEYSIPVYEVRPGIIQTDMTTEVTEKYDRLIAQGLLLEPRWGTPEDVGKAVAALVRGDVPYSTGTVLTLDGGLTVLRL